MRSSEGKDVINCPHREFLFDDVLRSTAGEYRCLVRREWQDANMKTADFPICTYKGNYEECERYNLKEAVEQREQVEKSDA